LEHGRSTRTDEKWKLLKEYSITINGRSYKVELGRHEEGTPLLVRVNDKPTEVEILNEVTENAPFSIKMGKKIYSVESPRVDRRKPFPVSVNNTDFQVALQKPSRKITPGATPSATPTAIAKSSQKIVEEGAITAPMAGKIISVRVKEGDLVKTGTVVCVLEAMKMENEITAMKSGTIQEVRASEGMAVNEGDILLIVK